MILLMQINRKTNYKTTAHPDLVQGLGERLFINEYYSLSRAKAARAAAGAFSSAGTVSSARASASHSTG